MKAFLGGYQSVSLRDSIKALGFKRGARFWYEDIKLCRRFAKMGLKVVK